MVDVLGKDGLVIRDSGSWAEEKLYYLGRYLKIMSVGMSKKWAGKLYYVDLFAGPGRCLIRETKEEIDGSPLIALLGFNFAEYFFIEENPACHQALDERVKARAPQKYEMVKILRGDCNSKISEIKPPTNGLGLAFIDPTGISQLSFDTIRELTRGRQLDLIINFPEGMGIRMNLHQYTEKEKTALNRFMGSARWQQRYQKSPTTFAQACREIAQEYLENLRSLGYIVVDSDRIPVRTNQNVLLYYLLFASKHPTGNDFWRKIKRKNFRGQIEMF